MDFDNEPEMTMADYKDSEYPSYGMDPDSIDNILEIPDLPDNTITRSIDSCLSHDTIFGCVQIIHDIGAIPILKEPIYLRTHPLNIRNVLDLPIFPFYKKEFERGIFSVDLFYNKTSRVRFDENSTDISAYIALENENLIRAIQNSILKIRQDFFADFNINMPAMMRLFSDLTIQERRIGLMLHLGGKFERIAAEIKTPILYTERNFFLTDEEINRINRAGIPGVCINPDAPLSEFAKRHMIADSIGMGDIRASLGYKAVDAYNWKTTVGAEVTIPSAFAFKRGLIGGKFEKNNCKPNFNICRMIDLAASAEPENQDLAAILATNFFIDALDKLASNLLDDPDGRYIGLGVFSESEITLTDRISIHSKNVVEYLAPAQAKRFFIKKSNRGSFQKRDFLDSNQAEDNLDFINQQFIDKFYPDVVQVKVYPGFLFKSTSRVEFHKNHWAITIGSDLWWKQSEKISTSSVPIELRDALDIEKGTAPEAYQSKVFGAIIYKKETEYRDWLISLAVDGTHTSTSIGEDFSVSLGFEFNF